MKDEMLQTINELLVEHGQIPQGLKELGIEGRRDCDARYNMYGLDIVLTDKFNVLDIGSNCGFLSCKIARKVAKVTGIDIDDTLIDIAILAARILKINNCVFSNEDIKEFESVLSYDLVISNQIHYWVKLPFTCYVEKLTRLVKEGGYLLFESHDTDNVDKDIDEKVSILMHKGFKVINSGDWVEDPGKYWIPPKAHKKIPREFYLMRYSNPNER